MEVLMRILLSLLSILVLLFSCSEPNNAGHADVNLNIYPYLDFYINEDGDVEVSVLKGADVETVIVPERIVLNGTEADVKVFRGFESYEDSSSLRSVILPDSLSAISDRALYGAGRLRNISIPLGLSYLGLGSLENTSLESITIGSDVLPSLKAALGSSASGLKKITVFGPSVIGIEEFASADDISFTLPENTPYWPELPALSRDGYVFYGWYTEDGVHVSEGMSVIKGYETARPVLISLDSPSISGEVSFTISYDGSYSLYPGDSLLLTFIDNEISGADIYKAELISEDSGKALEWSVAALSGTATVLEETEEYAVFSIESEGTYKIGCNVGDLQNQVNNYCELVFTCSSNQEE